MGRSIRSVTELRQEETGGDKRRWEETRGDGRRQEETGGDKRRREETGGGERRREETKGDERSMRSIGPARVILVTVDRETGDILGYGTPRGTDRLATGYCTRGLGVPGDRDCRVRPRPPPSRPNAERSGLCRIQHRRRSRSGWSKGVRPVPPDLGRLVRRAPNPSVHRRTFWYPAPSLERSAPRGLRGGHWARVPAAGGSSSPERLGGASELPTPPVSSRLLPSHFTPQSSTSKTSVALGGMTPLLPASPYPSAAGITSFRRPPTFIPATPSSQPAITWPRPSGKM